MNNFEKAIIKAEVAFKVADYIEKFVINDAMESIDYNQKYINENEENDAVIWCIENRRNEIDKKYEEIEQANALLKFLEKW